LNGSSVIGRLALRILYYYIKCSGHNGNPLDFNLGEFSYLALLCVGGCKYSSGKT